MGNGQGGEGTKWSDVRTRGGVVGKLVRGSGHTSRLRSPLILLVADPAPVLIKSRSI